MSEIELRMHYHDNDGLPDQLEVVKAPTVAYMSLAAIQTSGTRRLEIFEDNGVVFVMGTESLGQGRVAYQVCGWSDHHRGVRLMLLDAVPTEATS